MPTRAQRRRNQEAREAFAQQEVYIAGLPERAEEKLGIRREFVAEAIRSRGLVSLTMRPRGSANYLDVFGGAISLERPTGLSGDKIVNDWKLLRVEGFRVRFNEHSALIARLTPNFTVLDVSNIWLRTSDELLHPNLSISEQGDEERITMTRDGLTLLTNTIGHGVVGESLAHIEEQLFGQPTS